MKPDGRIETALAMMRDEGFRFLDPTDCISPAFMAQDGDKAGYPLRQDVREQLWGLIRRGKIIRAPQAGFPPLYRVYAFAAPDQPSTAAEHSVPNKKCNVFRGKVSGSVEITRFSADYGSLENNRCTLVFGHTGPHQYPTVKGGE